MSENIKNNEETSEVEEVFVPEKLGYLEDDAINALKAKHSIKHIHEIESVDEDGDLHYSYVKKPNLDQLQLLAQKAKQNKEIDGLVLMFKSVRVGGSEEVLTDSELLLSAAGAAGKLFKKRESKVKKR